MNTTDIINHDKQDYFPVFARYDIVLDHGDGAYLYDTNGKAYLDYLAGIAVNVVGHNFKPLVDAIANQAAKMIHCSNLYYTEVQAEAAAKLKALSGMDKVFFANSGAEANEGAIKLARKYATAKDPDKVQIITALHSFHGRTLAKGLAGGVPIGAFLSTKKLAHTFHAGDHGSTFGGNPLACAAANAVLTAIKEQKLMDNAAAVGNYLIAELKTL